MPVFGFKVIKVLFRTIFLATFLNPQLSTPYLRPTLNGST